MKTFSFFFSAIGFHPLTAFWYTTFKNDLLCLFVVCMLLAKLAILLQFQSVRVILLVLVCLVIALLALFTSQSQLVSCTCFASHVEHLHHRHPTDVSLRIKKDLNGDSKRNFTT